MDTSTRELDKEEHVVAAQEGGLDGEEVACEHARCLLAQELAPGGPRAPRRRQKASPREYPDERCWARLSGRAWRARRRCAGSPSADSHARAGARAGASRGRSAG